MGKIQLTKRSNDMAPVYEHADDIKELIQKVLKERKDIGWVEELSQIVEPEMIVCGLRTDKPAPKKQKWVIKIEGVRGSKTLLNAKAKYLIHGYVDRWDACPQEKKVAHIMHCLKKIEVPSMDDLAKLAEKNEDVEYGKLRKTDLEDFKTFVSALGLDWSEEGIDIPNLIDDKKLEV